MRFNYSPETGEFAIYADSDEFQLATRKNENDEHEFRVVLKDLKHKDGSNNDEAIYKFIDEYVNFINRILNDLHPNEKLKDIVIFSTMPKFGYTWSSLINHVFDDSYHFFEMLLTYGIHMIRNESNGKELVEILSENDYAKLTLAKMLLCSVELPGIWKVKKKPEEPKTKIQAKLINLKSKLEKFEKKYKFSSEQMLKYYQDDTFPEKDMSKWLTIYQEYKNFEMSLKKYELVDKILETWIKSFEENKE